MGDRTNAIRFAQSLVGNPAARTKVIDIYNTAYEKGPRKIKMKDGWAWCACTWSAIGIQTGNDDKMGVEISCGELIKIAKNKGIWVENDAYVPSPGDAVLYNWDDNQTGSGDNTKWPNHIGIVEQCYPDAGYFVVIEGNYDGGVKRRTVMVDGRYIRGFITPQYEEPWSPDVVENREPLSRDYTVVAREVISGKWGTGETRKNALEARGYDYRAVQDRVNDILNKNNSGASAEIPENSSGDFSEDQPTQYEMIAESKARCFDADVAGYYTTSADLHMRHGAGSNKANMIVIPKGKTIRCYGYYTLFNDVKWLYVTFKWEGKSYTGFCSGKYLDKAE